ncbi:MAG: dephospho-CoA kinase [Flavobacteriaceae bacterium CG_4_8_14_3_um_filter_34_10]|nr:dephospho-CoA kinase [Flavobacteriia bacterium]PIQ19120.1 MAG: dephospho-CoA kinase [Flavobacteriaceae bacterium CG18_big_fil_WC_8_21_14_2_50_34_36]PIV50954.1 MAG: dephospho-CoA kinase [Flavobacteriaceae bacterium CG02_land_8_20_14_3_00_34_13]PIX09284.1 MAG: dephospho-CoA kinase [Flavobacteriaceae bacterium CG_4_8_14_3_um_filter_34_10]PIZ07293.1 MAG: dephospho-CoA kinase [Flavobacteriaceae bacterium CG_4_10_14_0_8_um_filter_34_31]PJC06247.1 MAG: dephospho-CoA kinase [Flavobacteriaceae bacte
MKVVCLTGGIGSGKSTIAEMFKELGVSIYIADEEAKKLMQQNASLKQKIQQLLGEEAYKNGILNKKFIASKVFNNSELLQQLNALVHPAVGLHFEQWKRSQSGVYVIKEAAILFENGGYKQCDKTILVIAPVETRIQRVLKREATSKEEILARMQNQWPDERKIKLADIVIDNNQNLENIRIQVLKIHNQLLEKFH